MGNCWILQKDPAKNTGKSEIDMSVAEQKDNLSNNLSVIEMNKINSSRIKAANLSASIDKENSLQLPSSEDRRNHSLASHQLNEESRDVQFQSKDYYIGLKSLKSIPLIPVFDDSIVPRVSQNDQELTNLGTSRSP